jgi:hyperosmotically inducible protein
MYSVVLACLTLTLATPLQDVDARTRRVAEDIQEEILKIPNYGVFDNLAFAIEKGGTIRLSGQVIRGTLKDEAERRVKKVPGVDTVINEIEILPPSPTDDAIRLAVAQAIYRTDSLNLYAQQPIPPIHIIVKNGRVALEGAVDNQNDKTVAGLRAKEISGVFEVKNNLRVER